MMTSMGIIGGYVRVYCDILCLPKVYSKQGFAVNLFLNEKMHEDSFGNLAKKWS